MLKFRSSSVLYATSKSSSTYSESAGTVTLRLKRRSNRVWVGVVDGANFRRCGAGGNVRVRARRVSDAHALVERGQCAGHAGQSRRTGVREVIEERQCKSHRLAGIDETVSAAVGKRNEAEVERHF